MTVNDYFSNGQIVKLYAIAEFEESQEYGENMEGIALLIDDDYYEAYLDPDDGYRSYGNIYKPKEIRDNLNWNSFPAQELEVLIEDVDGYDGDFHYSYWKFALLNPKTKEVVFAVGTDTSDDYYPMAILYWSPENLPINEGK